MWKKLKRRLKKWINDVRVSNLKRTIAEKEAENLKTREKIDLLIGLNAAMFRIVFFGKKVSEEEINHMLLSFEKIKDK